MYATKTRNSIVMLINLIEQNKREEEWNERDKLAYMLSAYIHTHGIQKGCHRYDSTDNNTQRNQYVSFSQKLSAWHIEREATPEKLNMQVNRAHYKRSIRQVNITPSKWKKYSNKFLRKDVSVFTYLFLVKKCVFVEFISIIIATQWL